MSLYYASQSSHTINKGKFSRRPALGTTKTLGGKHRGWTFQYHEHQTGSSVKRTVCSASIRDPKGNRVEYLQGFTDAAAAGAAARSWIDAIHAKLQPAGAIAQPIPALPHKAKTETR